MSTLPRPDGLYAVLADLGQPVFATGAPARAHLSHQVPGPGQALLAVAGAMPPESLGAASFRTHHGVRAAYMAGAMAGGIAGTELVTALSRAGYLASLGAAGMSAQWLEEALTELRRELGEGPYACNLIHHPAAPQREQECVEACLRHQVRCIEASAFMRLSPALVRYRALGLTTAPDGRVVRAHRVIGKVSRMETAEMFLRPAPQPLLDELAAAGLVTAEQARLARLVPMADDLTVEADSGGHTDRRPLSVLLPAISRLRDRLHRERAEPGGTPVRLGAAGGIGTPAAVQAAFALGADYVVTGSVNQATVQAATSDAVKKLLGKAGFSDCTMAPAADMFEQGITVQVLGRGTLFAGRASRLYRLYSEYGGLEDLPDSQREHLEQQIFCQPLEEVWLRTEEYLAQQDPLLLERARADTKQRMALVFRWYLAHASRWACEGALERAADWQVWCGPAMGAFNSWVEGSTLADWRNRDAVRVADLLLRGAAYRTRLHHLRSSGLVLPVDVAEYRMPVPEPSVAGVPYQGGGRVPTAGAV
ncbi:PfaD family polyunsaturated fatty acid/polyketide biosynthesis protein [Streptomyces sp. A5-4]|uniref:PfaD family polyunsaturated fatty acid/polyketide biosynthesis protein n=1 Tax=Streptomyces sp. A5-4 TaxID=3384771 RepID=UPI003DA859B6